MKERPILFSAPMVRAILEGRKTQTRRVVKRPKRTPLGYILNPHLLVNKAKTWWQDPLYDRVGMSQECPYGQPGDRLWVRESWRIGAWNEEDGSVCLDYFDGPVKAWVEVPEGKNGEDIFGQHLTRVMRELHQRGVMRIEDGHYGWKPGKNPLGFKPSIHMPRWASRITLEITGVRVERLQDISEANARCEGVDGFTYGDNPLLAFRRLWWSINGLESWEENPWVWVVEFKRVEGDKTGGA